MIDPNRYYDTFEEFEALFSPCPFCGGQIYESGLIQCSQCGLLVNYSLVYDNFGEYEKVKFDCLHIEIRPFTVLVGNYDKIYFSVPPRGHTTIQMPISKFDTVKKWYAGGILKEKLQSLMVLV